MKPIYQPKGAAREYGDYALNIYTGCPHRCYYCFAPNVLHPRANAIGGILEEECRQLMLDFFKSKR